MNGLLLALSILCMPTLHRPASQLRVNDVVEHERWGRGIVIGRWGSFMACRECMSVVKGGWEKTPCCNRLPFEVNCEGVVEVQFQSGTQHVNQCWLKKPETL